MLKKSKTLLLQHFKNKEIKIIFPFVYLALLVLSFILILLYAAFPKLTTCFDMFGENICTPTGIYFSILLSLPGYIVAGNILNKIPQLPIAISLFFVIVTSILIYFYLGNIIDMLREKKLATKNLVNVILYLSFLIFITLLLSLI